MFCQIFAFESAPIQFLSYSLPERLCDQTGHLSITFLFAGFKINKDSFSKTCSLTLASYYILSVLFIRYTGFIRILKPKFSKFPKFPKF